MRGRARWCCWSRARISATRVRRDDDPASMPARRRPPRRRRLRDTRLQHPCSFLPFATPPAPTARPIVASLSLSAAFSLFLILRRRAFRLSSDFHLLLSLPCL